MKPALLELVALKNQLFGPVSFAVGAGECVAIMGPSGCGKTVLLRAISDLDPNDGDVLLERMSRNAMPAPQWRANVAMVPAESGWWTDNAIDHFKRGDRELIARLGLQPAALDWPIARLSSGERQRLAIARAIETGPSVLLLDEPAAMLDEANTGALEAVLGEHLQSGGAIVLVTHDAGQAQRIGNRLVKLQAGQVTSDQPTAAKTDP